LFTIIANKILESTLHAFTNLHAYSSSTPPHITSSSYSILFYLLSFEAQEGEKYRDSSNLLWMEEAKSRSKIEF